MKKVTSQFIQPWKHCRRSRIIRVLLKGTWVGVMGEGLSQSHFLSLWSKDHTVNQFFSLHPQKLDHHCSENQYNFLEFEICHFSSPLSQIAISPASPSLKHTNTCTINTDALLNFQNEDTEMLSLPTKYHFEPNIKNWFIQLKNQNNNKKTEKKQAVKEVYC